MNKIFQTTVLATSVALALFSQSVTAANTVTPNLSAQTQILGDGNNISTTQALNNSSDKITTIVGSDNTVTYNPSNDSQDYTYPNTITGNSNKIVNTKGNFISGSENTVGTANNHILGNGNTITSTSLNSGAVGHNQIIGDANNITDAVQNIVIGSGAAADLKNTTNQVVIGSANAKMAYGIGSVILGTEGGAGLYIQNTSRSVIAGGNDKMNHVINSFISTIGNGYDQQAAGDPADINNQGYTNDTSFYTVLDSVSQGQFNKIKNAYMVTQLGQQNIITGSDDDKFSSGVVQLGFNNQYTSNHTTDELSGVVQIGVNQISQGKNNVAIGTYASANIDDAVALGAYATTTTQAGVQGYLADGKDDTTWQATLAAVSVGDNINYTRQITGVAAGTADTDVVNVAQLKAAVFGTFTTVDAGDGIEVKKSEADNGGSLYTVGFNQATKDKLNTIDTLVANQTANNTRLDAIDAINARQDADIYNINKAMAAQNDSFNTRLTQTEKKLSAGIANAVALSTLPAPDKAGTHHVLFGTGYYDSQAAIALGATGTHQNGKSSYKAGLSWSEAGGFAAGVGGSYRWK